MQEQLLSETLVKHCASVLLPVLGNESSASCSQAALASRAMNRVHFHKVMSQ